MVSPLKMLRFQKRIEEIDKQTGCSKTGDQVIHYVSPYSLSQAFTKAQKIKRIMQPIAR
jgi:hypothetical protein